MVSFSNVNAGANKIEVLHGVDLDLVVDESDDVRDVAADLATGLHVTFTTLVEHGPAGGWPVVRFSGPLDQVQELVRRYENESNEPTQPTQLLVG